MRSTYVLLVSAALMLSVAPSAQRRLPGSQEKKVGVAIDLKVNGTPYALRGKQAAIISPKEAFTTSSRSDGR